jgi:hypothetical protein
MSDTRFWSKVNKTDGCWEWTAARNAYGYGTYWFNGKKGFLAHRASYLMFVGPIPDGLQLDHLCRNRGCVRPDHLEAVEPVTNSRRGMVATKTECVRGHPFTVENTRTSRGYRECVTCKQIRNDARPRKGK